MKYIQSILLAAIRAIGVVGALMLLVTVVRAETLPVQDYSQLSISETQFKQCSQKDQLVFARVRDAIQNKQYEFALETLGKPTKATLNNENYRETTYLYGKTLYLLAYQKVNERIAEQPDKAKLADAKKYIDVAAKQGLSEAVYDQAMLLTPPSDAAKKLQLLKISAEGQFVPAMLTLAEEYFHAAETFEQRLEAQALVQQAAAIDSGAKIRLASYYLHENKQLNNLTGYNKDLAKAVALLHAATGECNPDAAYKLFQMSMVEHKPNDLPTDRGIYWLEVSARLGSARAQGDLAEYHHDAQDSEQAVYWARQAAEHGDLKALLTLGKIYYHGVDTKKDHAKALGYYEQALSVDVHNRLVLNQLGIMYYKGEGGDVDFRKAASLCEQAANHGQAGCQYYLGLMYMNGEGVTQDIDVGISWMKKSAAQDFPVAKNWLRENW